MFILCARRNYYTFPDSYPHLDDPISTHVLPWSKTEIVVIRCRYQNVSTARRRRCNYDGVW